MCARAHAHMYMHMYVCTWRCACLRTCVDAHGGMHMGGCMCGGMYMSVHMCVYVYVSVCTWGCARTCGCALGVVAPGRCALFHTRVFPTWPGFEVPGAGVLVLQHSGCCGTEGSLVWCGGARLPALPAPSYESARGWGSNGGTSIFSVLGMIV